MVDGRAAFCVLLICSEMFPTMLFSIGPGNMTENWGTTTSSGTNVFVPVTSIKESVVTRKPERESKPTQSTPSSRWFKIENRTAYICGEVASCKGECEDAPKKHGVCSCRSDCIPQRRCCPDFEEYCHGGKEYEKANLIKDYVVCGSLWIGDIEFKRSIGTGGLNVVRKCPKSSPKEISDKCAGKVVPKLIKELYPYLPLVYNETIFGNTYCLNCHTGLWLPEGIEFIKPIIGSCRFKGGYDGDSLLSVVFRFCDVKLNKQSSEVNSVVIRNTCDEREYCKPNHHLHKLCKKYYHPLKIKKLDTDTIERVKNSFCAECLGYNAADFNITVDCSNTDREGGHMIIAGDLSGLFILPKADEICSTNDYLDENVGRCKPCPKSQLRNGVCETDYELYVTLFMEIYPQNGTESTDFLNLTSTAYLLKDKMAAIKNLKTHDVTTVEHCKQFSTCKVTVNVTMEMYRNVPVWSDPATIEMFLSYLVPPEPISGNISVLKANIRNLEDLDPKCEYTKYDMYDVLFQNVEDSDIIALNTTGEQYHLSSGQIYFDYSYFKNKTKYLTASICKLSALSPEKRVLDIISKVLQVFSLIGILFVIVTHIRFTVLRNQPGMNLLSLSVSMFVAILTFLLAPLAARLPILCSASGTFMHYAWLAVFTWMNVIAFDTWMTFRPSSIKIDQEARMKAYCRRALYAFGLPAGIIFISAILTYGVPGVEFKYGGPICWIGSLIQNVSTFTGPVGVICIVNLILFIWTVASIVKVKAMTEKVKSSKKETLAFLPYVKLSVILGISWILGLATVTGDILALRYIFSIVNSSQGMFLFLVFVSNPRVLRLWGFQKSALSSYTSSTSEVPSTVLRYDQKV